MSELERSDRSEAARRERLQADLAELRLDRAAAPPPRRRRWLARAALAAVLLAAVGFGASRLLVRPARVAVASATRVAAAQARIPVLSASGYLIPAQETISVGARVAGRVQRYLVEEGQHVKAGDALVQLDDAPYRATARERRAALAAARARLAFAESELKRAHRLVAAGVLGREELERRESAARVATAETQEDAAQLRRAEIDLDDTTVRAPTGGVVLETLKRPGEIAVPGGFSGSGDLVRLADMHEIRAEVEVNESDLTAVRLGQDADVTPDAFPDSHYAARVVELAPQIDRQRGTRKVKVRLLHPDGRLLPDMSARVRFFAELKAEPGSGDLVLIPIEALRRDKAGHEFVWTVKNGRARRVAVVAGASVGDRIQVRSGLAGGEDVVVGRPPKRDGERVEREP